MAATKAVSKVKTKDMKMVYLKVEKTVVSMDDWRAGPRGVYSAVKWVVY